MSARISEKKIPRGKWLHILPFDNPVESFYISIVMSLYSKQIEKKYAPVSKLDWLKICRKLLHAHFVVPAACMKELEDASGGAQS